MGKNKIAFVVIRYGKNINGGAEYHCRMLAERLVSYYDVDVLTTCVTNYAIAENVLAAGIEDINGVAVRRFPVDPINRSQRDIFLRKASKAHKLRRFLYRIDILKYVAKIFPNWNYKEEWEMKALQGYPFYSSELNKYVMEHKDEYKTFIPVNIIESPSFYTALNVPEKTIIIPTLHEMSVSFWSVLTHVMTKVAYIAFNTTAEERLAENIFGSHLAPHSVVGVGIELPQSADWEATRLKYNLPSEYLLFVGRIEPGKLHRIFSYFTAYKQKYPSSHLKLVMVGGLTYGKEPFSHPDILYTGFVSDEEKRTIIQHARIVINPSKFESLSLILLEAMNDEKPMLVNGKCAVLKEHCIKSNRAALYYTSKKTFLKNLYQMDSDKELCEEMGVKGKAYVKENYQWNKIISSLIAIIEKTGKK